MKKLIKVLVILVVGFAVLLVIASILLRVYLPPEKAKALVLQHLSAQLKREVSLGSVSVGLLSGLQMTELKISESPTFAKGTFLSSEQFSLKVALMPLLFRKVIVRQVVLDRPVVMIVRRADGKTFNFSDLTQSTEPVPPPTAGKKESLPFLFVVTRAVIQKGAVHFVDQSPAKQSMDIAPLDLTLKNVSLTTPFSVQTSLRVKSKGSDLALSFAGEADLLQGTFQIKQGSLVSKNTKITLSGGLKNLKTSEPAADLKITIAQLVLSDFAMFLSLPPEARIDGPWKGHATIQGDQKSMKVEALLDGLKTKIRYAPSFVKPENVPLSFSVQGVLKNLQEFDMQNVKCIFAGLVVSGHGRVQNLTGAQPSFNTHFETNAFSVEDLLVYAPGTLPPGITLKGTNQLNADLSGTPANLQFTAKWNGTSLAITKADTFTKPAGFPLDMSVKGTSVGTNKYFFKDINAHIGPNQLTGSGSYETRGTQAVVNLAVKGTNWAVQDLAALSPLVAPYKPTGTVSFDMRANGPAADPQVSIQSEADIGLPAIKHEFYEGKDLRMKWNLTQITEDLSKVSGTASLKQGPGKILNVDKLAESSRIGKIALAPLATLAKLQKKGVLKQVPLPSFDTVPFDSVVGDYLLRTGTMDIKTFDLNGKDLSILSRGTVGLSGAQPLNMNVALKLPEGFISGSLGNILKEDGPRPTVRFNVTGSVSDPQVKWAMMDVPKKAAQELLKNKEVQKAVGEGLEALKGIFH